MSECLRCGAGSEWIKGRVAVERVRIEIPDTSFTPKQVKGFIKQARVLFVSQHWGRDDTKAVDAFIKILKGEIR